MSYEYSPEGTAFKTGDAAHEDSLGLMQSLKAIGLGMRGKKAFVHEDGSVSDRPTRAMEMADARRAEMKEAGLDIVFDKFGRPYDASLMTEKDRGSLGASVHPEILILKRANFVGDEMDARTRDLCDSGRAGIMDVDVRDLRSRVDAVYGEPGVDGPDRGLVPGSTPAALLGAAVAERAVNLPDSQILREVPGIYQTHGTTDIPRGEGERWDMIAKSVEEHSERFIDRLQPFRNVAGESIPARPAALPAELARDARERSVLETAENWRPGVRVDHELHSHLGDISRETARTASLDPVTPVIAEPTRSHQPEIARENEAERAPAPGRARSMPFDPNMGMGM